MRYFTEFYYSEREHAEHVNGVMYRVPANVWFTSVHGLRVPDGHPGAQDSILLMAETEIELREKLRKYAAAPERVGT